MAVEPSLRCGSPSVVGHPSRLPSRWTSTGLRRQAFAWAYDRRSRDLEALGAASHRRRLVAGLGGLVVDVGAGNGLLFEHLPGSVAGLVAVEPDPYLRARAIEAASVAAVAVRVVAGTASALPLPDGVCDAAVCSLVLCSVPDLPAALAEIRRVLRPGGELRFYEHVVAAEQRRRRWQRLAEPAWSALVGGCRLTRDTVAAVGDAGFDVVGCEVFEFRPTWTAVLTSPHVLGTARR